MHRHARHGWHGRALGELRRWWGTRRSCPTTPRRWCTRLARTARCTLAAVEYVVIKSAWDATHKFPPKLFGHVFNLTPDGNRFGLPAFYSLHVWVFKHNSAGEFSMWNPAVICPA